MRTYALALSCAVLLAACGDNIPGDQPPTAAGRAVTTAEDTAAQFTVSATDPEGKPLTFTATPPAHGAITVSGDMLTYTPTADYNGPDTTTVTVSDGEFTATAQVAITVTPVNDLPVAVDDDIAAAEDTPATVTAASLLANDTDIDGDTLTVAEVGAAMHGTVALTGTSVTFTPEANYTGPASFTYTVSDGTATATATVDVAVGGANDAPVAVDDTATTDEDTELVALAATLVANDTDAEGQTLSVTGVGNPVHGNVTLVGGEARFQPDANYNGPASFEYTVSDGAATDTGTVSITVAPVNDAPVAVADSATTAEDTAATLTAASLLANDSDVDGTPTVSAVSGASNGTVDLVGTTITFTPSANFVGDAGFDYTITDGTLTATARVTIAVTAVNDAPVAVDDTATTAEDTAATITAASLLANDTDLDGTLTISAVAGASNGTVALVGTTITFTPTANFSGTAGFDYTVTDGALTDVGHVTVTVTPVNDAPVAVDDTRTTAEDTALAIVETALVSNDTDAEGATLTITGTAAVTGGTLARAAGTITFTPTADFNGTAGFDYTITDGSLTDVGHVTITVTAVNDAPVAVDDARTTAEDTAATITAASLLGNDTDVDGTPTVSGVSAATNGTVALVGTTITFTPAANFSGTAGFDYTITDGSLTDVGHVTVTVTAVNDAPVAVDDAATTAEDTAATITAASLLGNDTDVEGSALTVTGVGPATNGTVALVGTTITFTPAANFNGTAGFDYTITDGGLTDVGHVTVTVTAVNDAPVADDDSGTTSQDLDVTFADAVLLTGDLDVDGDVLTVASVQGAINGTVSRAGTVTTFRPTPGFTGLASFQYTVTDGALTDVGQVTISIGNVNDPPIAVADSATTDEDVALTIDAATLLANDSDPDLDPLTISGVSVPVNGTVALAGTTITFTPAADFSGVAGFDYTVTDGFLSATGHVTVTVSPINDGPIAVDDVVTFDEDTVATIAATSLTGNDNDIDGPALTVTAVDGATNGTVAIVGTDVVFTPTANFNGTAGFDYTVSDGTLTDIGHATLTINPVDDVPVAVADAAFTTEDIGVFVDVLVNDTGLGDGGITIVATNGTHGTTTAGASNVLYIPEANYAGTDTFTYTITDADGDPSTATVTVTLGAVNDAPVANSQSVATNQGAPVTITLTATDVDSPTVTFAVGTPPTGGALGAITPTGAFTATVVYTPTGAFSGPDSFTFTATDGTATSAPATVTITVNLVRPTVTATFPLDGATGVRTTTPVSVTFSTAMTVASLTGQTAAGPCTGTIQLSGDDFATCVGFTAAAPVMTAANTVATLQPVALSLVTLGVYKLRVDSAVTSALGNTMAATFTQANGFTIATDGTCAASLVISQVYGSGGLTGALFNADYVELHNPGPVPVSMNGMALQYASATGTSWSARALPNASVPPGGYFLVKLGPVGTNGAVPPADFIPTATMDMSGSNGKLALTQGTAALPPVACPLNLTLDLYGYGTANCFEGAAAPALSAAVAAFRGGAGCINNHATNTDFANAAPAPRNAATAPLTCSCTANETDKVAELDFCVLQFPPTITVNAGESTPLVFGRAFEAGVTPAPGASSQLRAEVGFGAAGVNPATTPGFTWLPAVFNVQVGNDDEYQASFTAPAAGSYGYTSRFTRDGTNWTYCDLNGAGSNAGLTFEATQLGALTSN